MENRTSSPGKRSKKAATPSPSTTSSTTGSSTQTDSPQQNSPDAKPIRSTRNKPDADEKRAQEHADSDGPADLKSPVSVDDDSHPPHVLSTEQQQLFLALLARGASSAAACQKLGITVADVSTTLEANPRFRTGLREVHETLNQNVVAALYRAAMEGKVTAQTFWLKNRPPPEWPAANANSNEDSEFKDLTDEELIELAAAAGIDLPPEIAPKAHSAGGEKES
jgi:hypothetical protein